MKIFYMHTINGDPAEYIPGQQICYYHYRQRRPLQLASSLKQILRERRATIKWRKERGFRTAAGAYGLVRIAI